MKSKLTITSDKIKGFAIVVKEIRDSQNDNLKVVKEINVITREINDKFIVGKGIADNTDNSLNEIVSVAKYKDKMTEKLIVLINEFELEEV